MRAQRSVSWVLIGLLIGLCSAGNGLAQEQEEQAGGADLAQQARNPTAALTQLQIIASYTSSFHNLDDADMTRLVLMPVIPFKLWDYQHIARITLPWVVSSPDWALLAGLDPGNIAPPGYVPTADVNGLGDTALFDLLIFDAPWQGKIAAGISAAVPTATDPALGTEKWSLGPAAGGLVQSGELIAGGIIMSSFSFAGKSDRDNVSILTVQPFASYGLGSGWSLELPEMMINYDFKSDRWTTLPLGVRIGKMAKIGNLPVRFYADAEYNFADEGVVSEWTWRLAAVPLI